MDFELTEEQRAFAQTARDFALAELAPHAAEWDAEGIFPKDAIAKAGELGFCGLYAPESAGVLALTAVHGPAVGHDDGNEHQHRALGGDPVTQRPAPCHQQLQVAGKECGHK